MKIHIEINSDYGLSDLESSILLALAGASSDRKGGHGEPTKGEDCDVEEGDGQIEGQEELDFDNEPTPEEREAADHGPRVTQPNEITPGMAAHAAEIDAIAEKHQEGEPGPDKPEETEATPYGPPPKSEKELKAMGVPELRYWSQAASLPIEDDHGYKTKKAQLIENLLGYINGAQDEVTAEAQAETLTEPVVDEPEETVQEETPEPQRATPEPAAVSNPWMF